MRGLILPATERRCVTRSRARAAVVRETRTADDDSATIARFTGHAAVFNTRTMIGRLPWGFYEEISPGAFTDTIADSGSSLGVDQAHLIDHDSYYVLARRSADTLRLAQDDVGLAVDSDLDTRITYVADHVINLEIGHVTGMSIGFYVDEATWSDEEIESDAGPITVEVRTITKISLLETSDVTFPAFPTTDAGLRDVAAALRRRDDHDAIARHIDAAGAHAPVLRSLVERDADGTTPPVRPVTARAASRRRDLAYADALGARHGLS